MDISFKFNLGQRVVIKDLSVTGKVVAYYYRHHIEYLVRYFDDAQPQDVYFLEDELHEVSNTPF